VHLVKPVRLDSLELTLKCNVDDEFCLSNNVRIIAICCFALPTVNHDIIMAIELCIIGIIACTSLLTCALIVGK
jgi:hypothetical protein